MQACNLTGEKILIFPWHSQCSWRQRHIVNQAQASLSNLHVHKHSHMMYMNSKGTCKQLTILTLSQALTFEPFCTNSSMIGSLPLYAATLSGVAPPCGYTCTHKIRSNLMRLTVHVKVSLYLPMIFNDIYWTYMYMCLLYIKLPSASAEQESKENSHNMCIQ